MSNGKYFIRLTNSFNQLSDPFLGTSDSNNLHTCTVRFVQICASALKVVYSSSGRYVSACVRYVVFVLS